MDVKDYTAGQSVPAAMITVVLSNLPLIGLYIIVTIVMSFGLEYVDPEDWSFGLVFIMQSFTYIFMGSVLGLATFSTVLLNTPGFRAFNWSIVFRFVWRDVVLLLLAGFGLAALGLLLIAISALFDGAADDTSGFYESVWLTFGFIAVGYVYLFLVYGFLGTWLAAVVVGGNSKYSAAVARGKRFFSRTFVRLIIFAGPFVLLMAISYSIGDEGLIQADGSIQWLWVIGSIFGTICETCVTVALALILARVYVETGD